MLIEPDLIESLSIITRDEDPCIHYGDFSTIIGASFNLWFMEGFVMSLVVEETWDKKLALSLKSIPNKHSPLDEGITLNCEIVPSMNKMNTSLTNLFNFFNKIVPQSLQLHFKSDMIKCGPKQALVVQHLMGALGYLGYDYYIEGNGNAILGISSPYIMQNLYPDIILKEDGENIVVTVYHPHLSKSYLQEKFLANRLNRRTLEVTEEFIINKRFVEYKKHLDETGLYQKVESTVKSLCDESKANLRQLISDFEELK
jgi:hypothetical protein